MMDIRSFPWVGVAMDTCTQVLHGRGFVFLVVYPGGELPDYPLTLRSAF